MSGVEMNKTVVNDEAVVVEGKGATETEPMKAETAWPSLTAAAAAILQVGDCREKARLALLLWDQWRAGENGAEGDASGAMPIGNVRGPERPARPTDVTVVDAKDAPKRGKGGSVALVHSLAMIESVAIDLALDILVRFGEEQMPRQFYDDWLRVAAEEAKHFYMLADRLVAMKSHFGALPVHGNLWESAAETSDSLLARLAVVACVHEARGLDVTSLVTMNKFRKSGDDASVKMMAEILADELTHVRDGITWFKFLCERDGKDAVSTFHEVVRARFRGNLKPPFADDLREQAGMTKEWYEPLAQ